MYKSKKVGCLCLFRIFYNRLISKHKGEHSAVFVEGIFPLDKNDKEKFALIYFDENEEPHIGRIRRLTPRECWRLQGFRDEQINKVLAKGISDHQMYKMAGNAVTVPVISAVAEIIKKVLSEGV